MAEGDEGLGLFDDDVIEHGESLLYAFGSDSPGRDHVVEAARKLVRRILDERSDPPVARINELAATLEEEESRFQMKLGFSDNVHSRSSHTIGRLLVLIKEDDLFLDLVLDCFTRDDKPLSLRAAAARLLLICVSCWMYTYTFDDFTLNLVKQLAREELQNTSGFVSDDAAGCPSDAVVLRTYAIGLFGCSLTGSEVAEETLSSGLPVKFMRYLRVWTFGDSIKPDHGNSDVDYREGKIRPRQHPDAMAIDKRVVSAEGESGESGKNQDAVKNEVEPMDVSEEKPRKKDRMDGKNRPNQIRDDGDMSNIRDRGGGRSRVKANGGVDEMYIRKDRGRTQASLNEDASKAYMADKVDISVFARRALSAAEDEARGANASEEAIKIAGESAAELVRAAALEALSTTDDEALVLAAAEAAAATVISAAGVVRLESEELKLKESKEKVEGGENNSDGNHGHGLDWKGLNVLKAQYCLRCLEKLGEYIDTLGPVLQERGVEVCLELLRRYLNSGASKERAMVSDVLRLLCVLSSHRKFATVFVDLGGMQQLLLVPRIPQHYSGISLCLVAVASLQVVMERVCSLSPSVVHDTVALAFYLLACPLDTARRSAAIFFNSSFFFRAIIDAFESQNGLGTFVNLLRNTVDRRSVNSNMIDNGDVLNSTDKQIIYHTCAALRPYFRASFLLLVDSLKPCKGHRNASRITSHIRDSSKPIDVSNEAIEAVIQQLSRDKKLATGFVKAKWPALEKFISQNGHVLLLELAQAAHGEKYLTDIAPHALAILQIVTLVPSTRRTVIGCTLSNGRSGMSVLLDAATFADQEVIQSALLILVNLVCPPPAFSSRSALSSTPGPVTPAPVSAFNGNSEVKERQVRGDDRADNGAGSSMSLSSPLVGDTRISLGPGCGGPGLAAYMEQGYRYARDTVRSYNGIKVLLHLLYPRTVLPPSAHIRALACRVLLGLARDEAIAQILTKLQVGKLLSELLRDGSQAHRTGQDRWQTELSQVALDLIGIVTNAGRASTVASEAAAPTLRRIERAAIAAATPISYHSKELLQLIHEHLLAAGLIGTASCLLKEAQLVPLTSSLLVASLPNSSTGQEILSDQKVRMQWPSGRINGGLFLSVKPGTEDSHFDISRKKIAGKSLVTPKKTPFGKEANGLDGQDSHAATGVEDSACNTPSLSRSSLKRKPSERDVSPNKRPHVSSNGAFTTPQVRFKGNDNSETTTITPMAQDTETKAWVTPAAEKFEEFPEHSTVSTPTPASQHPNPFKAHERATLDSLVVQYLKHQHRQCPAPITTLPPISLLHSHVCPEPSRALYASYNTASRLGMREINPPYSGMHGRRHDRHFIYSRFRLVRVSRDDEERMLTCGTFLKAHNGYFAAGCHAGSILIFDANSGTTVERNNCHLSPVTHLESSPQLVPSESGTGQLLLSAAAASDVKLWNSTSLATGPLHTFDSLKSPQFNHAGTMIGATNSMKVVLYDVNTCTLKNTLTDSRMTATHRIQIPLSVHFSPSDTMVLWNGVLWDHRIAGPIHRFDQFTDYGGGGFHPAGNEVIINSEVWDLRTFKLLRSVPSLDQTVLTFNPRGDVIYATLRRHTDEVALALHNKRARHPLFTAFRTIDAVDYSDIATTQVDRCVLSLATESSESVIGVVAMEANQVMDSYVKFYEVGRRRPTDDDSDPDDGMDTDEENEGDGDDEDEDDDDDDDDGPRLLSAGSSISNEDVDEDELQVELSGDEAVNGLEFLSDGDDDGDRSSYDEDSDDGLDLSWEL